MNHGRSRRQAQSCDRFFGAPRTASQLSLVDRVARRAVLAALNSPSGSAVRLRDEQGETLCGADRDAAAELTVVDPRFWRSTASRGNLGFAEAYLAGWWTTPDLLPLLTTLAGAAAEPRRFGPGSLAATFGNFALRLARRNTRRGSRANIHAHYDLSNEFFATLLDPSMTYSCGLFESPQTDLAAAQSAKYERICRLLDLSPRDHVAEIGCGWGGFAEYAATNFGCRVTGITISREQLEFAQRRIARARLGDRVELRFCDYRDFHGRFDKLVSIEMIEAVGHESLGGFFAKCSELLKPAGKMALQAITIPDQRYDGYRRRVDYIQKYVFPGGHLPSLGAIHRALGRRTDLRLVECVDFAGDYARTLVAWRERFFAARERIAELGFDDRFVRTWDYYLCYCAAGFARRLIGLAQIALAKPDAR